METKLFDGHILGPIKSKSLGNSLIIDLLGFDSILCSLNNDCNYKKAEKGRKSKYSLPSSAVISELLINKIKILTKSGISIDSISFTGSNELKLQPVFEEIISDVVAIRNVLIPEAKIAKSSTCFL